MGNAEAWREAADHLIEAKNRKSWWERRKERKAKNRAELQEKINIAGKNLAEFLKSDDGLAGLALLSASGKYIFLGRPMFSIGSEEYRLDKDGLKKVWYTSSGSWPEIKAYTYYSEISVKKAIEVAVKYQWMEPDEVLPYIVSKIEKIVQKAKRK